MNHIELHNKMSDVLQDLLDGKVKPQFAREYFNGCGKLINNCKNELVATSMGMKVDIPLLEIDKDGVSTNIDETIKEIDRKRKVPYNLG